MTLADFNNCRTVTETNEVYKALFIRMKAEHDRKVAAQLQENHRKAMERIIFDLRASAEDTVQRRQRSDDDLHSPSVKNWALRMGLVLPKGRINKEIKQAYRDAHSESVAQVAPDVPEMPVEPPEPTETLIASAAEIRRWCRSEGIECSTRGRIHPDLRSQYNEAHS